MDIGKLKDTKTMNNKKKKRKILFTYSKDTTIWTTPSLVYNKSDYGVDFALLILCWSVGIQIRNI